MGRKWRGTAALIIAATVLAACSGGGSGASSRAPSLPATGTHDGRPSSNARTGTPAAPVPGTPAPGTATPVQPRRGSGAPVHVALYEGDGATYGVAMPIIAYFSAEVADASVFDEVTQVTVDGRPVHGAWYWERASQPGYAMEAHYRLASYWPAHATIHLSLPIEGLWAGTGLVFDDSLTLTMHTGARHVVEIDGTPGVDSMRVYSDGKLIRSVKVSLGAARTPTYLGTAVVMSKSNPQLMTSSPGEPYYRIEVPWSVRVTYDGEFLHDAYWNDQLGRLNLSHGCTNLSPSQAEWYYHWSLIGDPVTWTHTGTSTVLPVWDGWGDWNLDFAQYRRGGLLPPA